MSGFKMDDYVDVAQRIHDFYERFPDGRLVNGSPPFVVEVGGKPFVWYHARAYRTPDDPLPGDGWAAEPVPGPTQFTKDSELMNAETAAWGRAIVALGFSTKKIASAQEVKARTSEPAARVGAAGQVAAGAGTSAAGTDTDPPAAATPSDTDLEALFAMVEEKGGDVATTRAGAVTAKKEGKLGTWYPAALTYWQAQKVPFKIPAGVAG